VVRGGGGGGGGLSSSESPGKEPTSSSSSSSSAAVAAAAARTKARKQSLPGWGGRPPIFIPSSRCSLEIRIASSSTSSSSSSSSSSSPSNGTVFQSGSGSASNAHSSVLFNLSHLRLFAVAAPSPRIAVRKLHEFCSTFFVKHTANLIIPGGISALNIAALHGNLEVRMHVE
jgi:hypothetical protein